MGLVQKAFSDIITFSRSSNATRVGPTGRVEYAPHNLLTYSEQFDNAAWTKLNATITANSTTAPNGTVAADTLVETAASGVHRIAQGFTPAVASYTTSVYVKASTRTWLAIQNDFGSNNTQQFYNIGTGVLGSQGGFGGTATITFVGNGWYRCTLTTTTTSTTAGGVNIYVTTGDGTFSYTGDGTSGIFIWGAQLSVGPYALDYTPTTSAAVYGPRFDYDPVTLAARGLLVEESRTNLSTYSEDFSNAAWVAYLASKTANFATAPNGTITANRIAENAANSLQAIYNTISTSTTGARTVSVFAKAAERSFFRVSLSGVGATEWFGATFDLQNGTVTQQNAGAAGTVSGATITAFGSGWYRCTVTGDTGATGVTYAYIGPALTGTPSAGSFGVLTYSGNSSNGVLAWGAQVEQASFATSYIPTLASTVTRSADVASVNTLSPWFNATEGTVFTDADLIGSASLGMIAELGDGGYNNRIGTFGDQFAASAFIVDTGGVRQATLLPGSFTFNTPFRIAATYKLNDFAASRNGAAVVTDTSGTVPTVTTLYLGYQGGGGGFLNGHIRRLAYYPRRLTNAELQALTA